MSVIGNILFQSLSHDLSVCVCVTCETQRRVRRQEFGTASASHEMFAKLFQNLQIRTASEVS